MYSKPKLQLSRNYLLKQVVILFFLCFSFYFSKAQSSVDSPYIPNIIPPSPNAAALMKFTDVPVSTYTGTTDVTVPIYTINVKGITVPVSISYHTGGIKLEEEASWVGLGWALNAGGMISRTIMGHDDFGTQGDIYLANQCPQLQGDILGTGSQPPQGQTPLSQYFFDFFCSYKVATSNGTEDFYPAFTGGADVYDMEPDIFSYNFPGHSGKFILTRSGQVVMEKQENIKIQFQGTGNQVTFTVLDNEGNTFYFNTTELVDQSPKPAQISSWLLTKIITQQKDSIIFNYASGGTTSSSMPEINQTYGAYCTNLNGLISTNSNLSAYYNQTLKSIDFADGHIQFASDSIRNDLTGAYKLDSIIIYSKNAAGIQTYLKQDNFYYSYFNPTYAPVSNNPEEYYRLKLDSVKELSGGTKIAPYSFIYNNHDPGLGTAKHSFNVDHWGFYNGADNSVLIPTMDVYYQPNGSVENDQVLHYSGANRLPSFPAMQTFSLQQVSYPTGGKSVFSYQANDYDFGNSGNPGVSPFQYVQLVSMDSNIVATNHGYISGTIDLTNIFPIIPQGFSGTNVTVNVTFRYKSNNNFPYSNTSGKLYFILGGTAWDIHTATCQSNSPVCTSSLTYTVNPGVYSWSAYIDPSIDTANTFQGIYISVQYQETQQVYNLLQNNSYISPASGLRIQSVTNYSNATTIASKKIYSYNYSQDKAGNGQVQQYSYGRLMSIPSYARYQTTVETTPNGQVNCIALVLFSSSLTSLTGIMQGNIVGYDQVTETSIDPVSGNDIGKTVYQFYNRSDTATQYQGYSIPGTLNLGYSLNGLLMSKTDYSDINGAYNKLSETDNYYHATNRTVYYSPKYQYIPAGSRYTTSCAGDSTVEIQTLAWFYPSIKSERILLDSTYQYAFDQNSPSNHLLSINRNYYDDTLHYQITRQRATDSKNNSHVTRIKYPQDYIPNGQNVTGNAILDSLIAHNMVAVPIEKTDSFYLNGSQSGSVTGSTLSVFQQSSVTKSMQLSKQYLLSLTGAVTDFQPFAVNGNSTSQDSRYRQMVSFDSYDSSNNITQYTATDQLPNSFIWDYKHAYPIAKVMNAPLSQVAYTSFEADGKGGWSFTGTPVADATSPTGNNCYQLTTGSISKSGLTSTTTYVISFWRKSGASVSLSGGTWAGVQGKTIGNWTFYEDTIKGATTVTVSGSGYIDELRLYPSNAQMTTYTYTPLIGMTTSTDADNRISYYFYDGLGRLKWIKDQDGNIIKTFQYHYTGVPGAQY